MLVRAEISTVETWELPKKPLGHVVGFSNREAGATRGSDICTAVTAADRIHRKRRKGDTRGHERRLGYQQAVRELGLPKGRVVRFGEPPASMSQGTEALSLMLGQWPDTDAIVCVSDLQPSACSRNVSVAGWQVPARVALAGFGDFEVARCCHPRLTTIAVDCRDIGRRAAEIALGALEERKRGKTMAPKSTIVSFHVIERETA